MTLSSQPLGFTNGKALEPEGAPGLSSGDAGLYAALSGRRNLARHWKANQKEISKCLAI